MTKTPPAAQGPTADDMPLATELATYEAKRAELLRESEGSYVLIKGTEIIGVFPTEDEAYEEAVSRFGFGPFMIRQVRERDEVLFIPVPVIEL